MPRLVWHPGRWLPALLGGVLGFHPIAEADTFWHLMLGRAVLRHGSRSVPEPTAHLAWSDPCVAVEWLWDVFTLLVHRAGGDAALSLLSVGFGALIGYLAGMLVDSRAPRASGVLRCALALIATCAVTDLLNVRPNLVFLALLPWFTWLAYRYVGGLSANTAPEATAPEATRATSQVTLGIALVVTAHAWAQLHASFVLALPIFLCVLVPAWRAFWSREGRQGPLVITLGLLLTVFTGPTGSDIVDVVVAHSHGDAVLHIADMQPFDWATLGPFAWPPGAAICLLLLLPICVWLAGARLELAGVLLVGLGAAMTFTAQRFVMPWALLALPLAAVAAQDLTLRHGEHERHTRHIELAALAICACMMVWSFRHADRLYGPMLRTGARVGAYPEAAARYLSTMAAGTPVLSEYEVGGPVGFWLDGHVRTFVDGRTPMYFDDTDAAVARDILSSQGASQLAIARYGAKVAVVTRTTGLCQDLAAHWKPVVIEPRFTTFVPIDAAVGSGLPGLLPCGPFYLAERACSDGGRGLAQSIATLEAIHKTPFAGFLRAAAAIQCDSASPAKARGWLPSQSDARMYLPAYRLYSSWAALSAGHSDAALAIIEVGLAHADPLSLRVLLEPEAAALPLARLRLLFERGLRQMDDNAPPPLRARLALICMAQQDAECARFHGLRAYLSGAKQAEPALKWAADHHPSIRVRNDLHAWLKTPMP